MEVTFITINQSRATLAPETPKFFHSEYPEFEP